MLTSFHFALSFLTTLPFPFRGTLEDEEIGRSLAWFPLVGLVVGLCLAATWLLLRPWLPRPVVMVMVMAVHLLVTGGFHLDGLADTADGWFSGRGSREAVLEIMKDSAIGTMGALALMLLLLFKYVSLACLANADTATAALLLMPVYGRFAIVLLAYLSPYARPEGGLGKAITDGAGDRELLLAASSTVIMALLLGGWPALAIMLFIAACTWLAGRRCRQRLGGVTGDLLGGICETAEALALLGWLFFLGR
ncbi:MAG: adenosylcobinamide-GDP ribazoletransferase [Deltaproteobacteria bacterium]|nr:adenosylcobinamide-GDP ribazoletransferase [Deltaproteobacteria bacterium]